MIKTLKHWYVNRVRLSAAYHYFIIAWVAGGFGIALTLTERCQMPSDVTGVAIKSLEGLAYLVTVPMAIILPMTIRQRLLFLLGLLGLLILSNALEVSGMFLTGFYLLAAVILTTHAWKTRHDIAWRWPFFLLFASLLVWGLVLASYSACPIKHKPLPPCTEEQRKAYPMPSLPSDDRIECQWTK